MRKMKDSGIEWIGEIPENWDTIRVKHLATEKDTLFLDGDWINSDVIVDEGIRYLTSGNVGEGVYKEQGKGYISEETFNKLNCLTVYPGDLMISRLNEPVGRCCIVPEGEEYYVVAVDNVILRPNHNFHKKYLLYCMNTTGYARAALMAASGTTMQRISRTSLGNMAVPVTSYEEQFLIADYLDKKCAEIDAIIAAKEKTNELLKERRQSIIYEAVTKGLDPTVPMKDSGIEWIGKIPESWSFSKLKYDAYMKGRIGWQGLKADEFIEEGTYLVTGTDFEDGKVRWERSYHISEERFNEAPEIQLKEQDLLITKDGTIGKLAYIDYLPGLASLNSHLLVIRPKRERFLNKYLYWVLSSDVFVQYTEYAQDGTIMASLSQEKISQFVFGLPSIQEQQMIAKYLDEQCAEIDALISANESTIEKLKEYRQSVIYEAVTGKVEI